MIGLPSGRLLRGRGPRGRYILNLRSASTCKLSHPYRSAGRHGGVRWRDCWLPADPADPRDALIEVWQRAETQRVEVACSGDSGRTGTALACIAILDGVAAADAIEYVREYDRHAVEAPWQWRFVARFSGRFALS